MVGSKKAAGGALNPASKAFVPGGTSKSSASTTARPPPQSASPPRKATTSPVAAKPAGAWGSKPLDAVRAAPQRPPSFAAAAQKPASSTKPVSRQGSRGGSQNQNKWSRGGNNSQNSNNNRPQRQRSGGGGGRDRRNHHHHRDRQNNSFVILDLCEPGDGKTDAQKAVKRLVFSDLLAARLDFLEPPADPEWKPPEACHWCEDARQEEITSSHKAPRMTGEVSMERRRSKKNVVETAPPLEECKPLEVNDETRWKARVMQDPSAEEEKEESDEEVLKKALLILNKLSLTKFDKLSDGFIATGIGRNKNCLEGAIGLIVTKAQGEPHFANMYAQLCFKLAMQEFSLEEGKSSKKTFKKLLLGRCQSEFEIDTAHKIAQATEGTTDKEEIEYKASLIKKNYLGHMRFIGELYKGDMIKIEIMLWCLKTLLTGEEEDKQKDTDDVEEEKVECFAKLMTTIGGSLEQQSVALVNVGKPNAQKELNECWRTVEIMAGKRQEQGPHVSNRVKFMLQDLLEMRDKGWVTRRKEETAKTLQQIHQEVAKEERKAAARRSSSSGNLRGSLGPRRASSGDVRVVDRRDSSKSQIVDQDGFVQIVSKGSDRRGSSSTPVLHRSVSAPNSFNKSTKMKRSGSIGNVKKGGGASPPTAPPKVTGKPAETKKEEEKPKEKEVSYLSPDECGKKAISVLKEYFVGGDTDDAVLSFEELIGAKADGTVERGSKVVESSVLMVMEMKREEVTKMLTVLTRIVKENKIQEESLVKGFNDPLEFLSDIVVDAPLADKHLASIVSELIQMKAVSLDFLLSAPEYFRTDGKAAHFAAKVVKKLGGEDTQHVSVVEQLMTQDDKDSYATANDLLASV